MIIRSALLLVITLSLPGCYLMTSTNLMTGVIQWCNLTDEERANIRPKIKRGIYPHKGAIKCVDRKSRKYGW